MKKFFESLSLEVRVGVLILVAVGLLTTFVLALGSTSPKPARRAQQPTQITLMHGPFEFECSEERSLVCRCE